VSFSAITLCVASQRVFIVVIVVYFVTTQSGNFWIHSRRFFFFLYIFQSVHLMFQLIILSVLLVGAVPNFVKALGYSSQGEQQDLGQDQGQAGGNFARGRQDSLSQQGAFGAGDGRSRYGAKERSYGGYQYGGQPGGEDASQYNFRIYTEPEYYGYESKFPGGKAVYKSYRSADPAFGEYRMIRI
jgi:type II secretory pathway pseudopilin PulG